MAMGIFEGHMLKMADGFKAIRLAELELDDLYDSGQHDAMFKGFTWKDFNQQERALIPAVLVLCQPATTVWENISRLLSSRYPIKIAMINSDGISIASAKDGPMGEQARPSPTIMGTQPDLLALEHANTSIIQATVGHSANLIESVVEALQHDGPAMVHVYAPDPRTSGTAMEKIIEHAALAYQTRVFPLFRINRRQSGPSLTIEANPDTENDWTTCELEVSEPSGVKSSLSTPLTPAHWALGESRFQQRFEVVANG